MAPNKLKWGMAYIICYYPLHLLIRKRILMKTLKIRMNGKYYLTHVTFILIHEMKWNFHQKFWKPVETVRYHGNVETHYVTGEVKGMQC